MSRKTSTPEEQFFQRASELVEREDWDGLAEACEAHLIIDEDCGEAYFPPRVVGLHAERFRGGP